MAGVRGAGWIGTGLAMRMSGEPGAECRGTFGPIFLPDALMLRGLQSRTARNGADATAGRTEQGGSGIPRRGVDMERVAEYVAMRRIRSIGG
jgi:hypothetical protein